MIMQLPNKANNELDQLSAIACIGFLSASTWLQIKYWWTVRRKKIQGLSQQVAKPQTLRYLHTQFGVIFFTLILADTLQAIAFAFGFHWLTHPRTAPVARKSLLCIAIRLIDVLRS
jgi:hypothetical protein